MGDILASSKQVAEGVSTAGVVVALARKYRVKLPVLTAVAHILNSDLAPRHAVAEIMNLPLRWDEIVCVGKAGGA